MRSRSFRMAILAMAVAGTLAFGQNIISAKSGLIHYLEGRVLLDDKVLDTKLTTRFPELKEQSVLRTEEGRAEVLLAPGVFLRVAENSSLKMLDSRLASTRVELLGGSALVEVAELLTGNSVTFLYKDSSINLIKKGLYRFDSDPAGVRVYDGEAQVIEGAQRVAVKGGKVFAFDGSGTLAKFDKEAGDSLHRWSNRRAGYLSMASVSAAHSIYTGSSLWSASGWRWNPWFGMFTFVPVTGVYRSPFGWSFWSPYRVYEAFYVPQTAYARGGGGFGGPYYDSSSGAIVNSRGGMATSGGMYSGGGAPAASGGAVSSAPAASPRGGDGAIGRGSSGGGR